MWRNVVAPAVIVVLFWLASSLSTTYYVRWIDRSQASLLSESLSTIQSAGAMRYTLRHMQDAVLSAGHKKTPEAMEDISRLEEEFGRYLEASRLSSLTESEQKILEQVVQNYAAFRSETHRWLAAITTTQPATTAGVQRLMRLADSVAEPCKKLSDLNEKQVQEDAGRTRDMASSLTTIRLALLIVGPTLGILCGFWISRRFHRSISRISITLNDAASDSDQPLARVDLKPTAGLPELHERAQAVAGRFRDMVQELEQARRDTLAAARLAAVGELAAGVAHELRNPLTSVKLLIQTAAQREAPLPPKQIEVIEKEIDRMERTIDRLLQFARPPKMKRLRHDLRETVQRSLNLIAGRASQAAVAVELCQSEHPVWASADGDQLHQAILNLLINAIEAMERGGRIEVGVSAAGPMCRVVMRDSGPGIPPSVFDRIFEPFVTSKERGTGLGLAISRRIVAENGGRLTAANHPEGGAVFTLELPLAEAPAEAPAPSALSRALDEPTIGEPTHA